MPADDDTEASWVFDKTGLITQNMDIVKESFRKLELPESLVREVIQNSLDAKLPDVEGLELAGRIRALDPAVQIVIISGYFYDDDIEIQRALNEGLISGFISKPFSHETVYQVIPDSFVNES